MGWAWLEKGSRKEPCCGGTVCMLTVVVVTEIYTPDRTAQNKLHTCTHSQMRACKMGEICMSVVHCTNVNLLVLLCKMLSLEETGQRAPGTFLYTSLVTPCESIIISK